MLSSGLLNVLTTSHPAVKKIDPNSSGQQAHSKQSKDPSVFFSISRQLLWRNPLSFKDLQHFHSSQPPATSTSRTISGYENLPSGTHGTWRSLATGKLVPSQGLKGKSKVRGRHPWKPTRSNEIENAHWKARHVLNKDNHLPNLYFRQVSISIFPVFRGVYIEDAVSVSE